MAASGRQKACGRAVFAPEMHGGAHAAAQALRGERIFFAPPAFVAAAPVKRVKSRASFTVQRCSYRRGAPSRRLPLCAAARPPPACAVQTAPPPRRAGSARIHGAAFSAVCRRSTVSASPPVIALRRLKKGGRPAVLFGTRRAARTFLRKNRRYLYSSTSRCKCSKRAFAVSSFFRNRSSALSGNWFFSLEYRVSLFRKF